MRQTSCADAVPDTTACIDRTNVDSRTTPSAEDILDVYRAALRVAAQKRMAQMMDRLRGLSDHPLTREDFHALLRRLNARADEPDQAAAIFHVLTRAGTLRTDPTGREVLGDYRRPVRPGGPVCAATLWRLRRQA